MVHLKGAGRSAAPEIPGRRLSAMLDYFILSFITLNIGLPIGTELRKIRFVDDGESSETSIECGNNSIGFGVAPLHILNGDEGEAPEVPIRHF